MKIWGGARLSCCFRYSHNKVIPSLLQKTGPPFLLMNLLDLFSGIGGFHLGLEQAGFEFDWVGFSEIDKYANKLYKRRFPDGWTEGQSDTQRYKQLGNAVSVPVVKAVGEKLLNG